MCKQVLCGHCNKPSKLVTGKFLYPHRPDLFKKWYYYCKGCNAYVGCHKDTENPYGTPANAKLRKLRNEAHKAFDKLWQSGLLTRTQAYSDLANYMELHIDATHIGMFEANQCLDTISFSNRHFKDLLSKQESNL